MSFKWFSFEIKDEKYSMDSSTLQERMDSGGGGFRIKKSKNKIYTSQALAKIGYANNEIDEYILNHKAQIIASYLEPFKDEIQSLYSWKFDLESLEKLKLLNYSEIQSIKNCENNDYQKEILLKQYISSYLNNELEKSKTPSKLFLEICEWIIKSWGGIKSGELIIDNESIKAIEKSTLSFDRIASYSKIASFLNPQKSIIYDSRVAYSINWILLSSNDIENEFFPIPEGRNSKLIAFDMNVLLHLKFINVFQNSLNELSKKSFVKNIDSQLYLPKKVAYYQLNKLINLTHKQLWGENDSELYKTEMLLFSIADNKIILDIINRTTISIK